MRLAILLLSMLASITSDVFAADSYFLQAYGTWGLYIDPTLENSCYVTNVYSDNTGIRVGFSSTKKPSSFLLVYNNRWASIEDGKDYDLFVGFDGGAPIKVIGHGGRLTGSPSLLFYVFDDEFYQQFSRKNTMTITYNGDVVAKISLEGTVLAIQALFKCQEYMIHKSQEENKDPFSPRDNKQEIKPKGAFEL